MTQLHISTPEGGQAAYPEDQVRGLWQQGAFAENTLYWKEGMTDWRPLREYFREATPALAPPLPPSRLTFVKDPTALTMFVKTMLWIYLAENVVSLFSDFAQLQLARGGPIQHEAAVANDARQQVIGIVLIVTYLVTAIAFLKWIYRANVNSRGFGAVGLKFTPGWAVGFYFVPFANLFYPFRAMREIWQASQSPSEWRIQPSSALLGWWWALWLLSNVLGQVAFRLSREVNSAATLESATIAVILASAIHIPLSLVALSMISTIFRRQETLVAQGR